MINNQQQGIKKRVWLFLPLLISLLFIGFLFFSLNADRNRADIAKPFPEFSADSLIESDKSLSKSVLQGKVSIVNVWASWCSVCKKEHDFLLSLAKQPQLNVIGLNYRDNKKAALDWLNTKGNPYQAIIFDPQGKLALELGVVGTPETYLVDKSGNVCFRYSGELTKERWQNYFLAKIAKIQESGKCPL